jgi:hypothetical protein
MERIPLQRLTVNLSHKIKWVKQHGRNYLVAPMTLINPGVLNGSKGPLLYPPDEVAKNPQQWNGVPIVVYHPHRLGQPVSASEPGILDSQGVGEVRNATSNGKLQAEGWFDVQKIQKVNPVLYQRLLKNEAIELSTGLYTDNEDSSGSFKGRPYTAIARNYRPDHLAILPDQTGACSVKDGCGVLVNSDGLKEKLHSLLNNVWSDEAREAALDARKRGVKGGMPPTGEVAEGSSGNDAQIAFPHMAHLLNGARIHAVGMSKKDAHAEALKLRAKGIYASGFADPKGKRGKQYMIVIPESTPSLNQEFNMDLQHKLSLLLNAQPSDDIDPDKACKILEDGTVQGQPLTEEQKGMFGAACGQSKEENSCGSKEENCDVVKNQKGGDNTSSVTLKTDSPTKLVEPATLKAAIELHDLITGAAESPLKQECLKASEKFLKKFQAHLNDSEEENEDTEVEIQNKSVTDNRHTKKEGGQHMAQEVKLSKEERKAVVDGLIVNEGCCWEESDREVLNTMNDTTLAKLHKQMELVANATVSEVLGEDSEEDVAVEEEKTKKGQSQADGKVAPVGELDPGVKGKPAMNTLNEQDRRDLAFARHYRMEQRKQHIGVITANANNKFTPKQLETMDDGVLANMAMLAKPLENTEYYPATEAMTRPSFFGSQGAAVVNANAGADEEPLVLGRIDYKELSANNGHK